MQDNDEGYGQISARVASCHSALGGAVNSSATSECLPEYLATYCLRRSHFVFSYRREQRSLESMYPQVSPHEKTVGWLTEIWNHG